MKFSSLVAVFLLASAAFAQDGVVLDKPTPPPDWALAERALLDAASDGVEAFAERYVDSRGYLKCVERWGGNDGADDAMENFEGWTLLYALGGDEKVLDLYHKAWIGHLEQFTKAKAPGIEMAKDGMYWREFVTAFDWEHNGEALAAFHLYALDRPDDPRYKDRVMRFADFYTGADPLADNYDSAHKIIKSIQNGSRGAKVTPASEMDWGGLPVKGAPDRLTRYATASNIKGDHPLNLGSTALGFNAYLLSREERYRDWVLEYAGAWRDRVLQNNGNIPTNIGLDGRIGGDWGKWYGGVFGWNFWPQSSGRNYFIRGPRIGFAVAALLSRDMSYLEPLRRQIANLYAAKKVENGRTLIPHKYGDKGWYGYTPNTFVDVQRDVYLFTFDRTSLEGLADDPWIRYLDGDNPDYPMDALRRDLGGVRRRVAGMRADRSIDWERASDATQRFDPASVDSLTTLTLGANPPGHSGNILHSRLLYYDPARRRVGLPQDVAALVESITPDGVKVRLVNLDQAQGRSVWIRAGAYGEHRFTGVSANGSHRDLDAGMLRVRLEPGAGGTLDLAMKTFVSDPEPYALSR